MKPSTLTATAVLILTFCALAASEEQPHEPNPGKVPSAPTADEGQSESPEAVAGFDWLAGEWHLKEGKIQCDEYWAEPRSGSQHGSFRLTHGTETRFLEIFCIQQEKTGVVLRLRHFSPALRAWKGEEENPRMWRLTKTAKRRAVFEGDTSRVVYHRESENVLVVRLEPLRPAAGTASQGQVFRFTRVKR